MVRITCSNCSAFLETPPGAPHFTCPRCQQLLTVMVLIICSGCCLIFVLQAHSQVSRLMASVGSNGEAERTNPNSVLFNSVGEFHFFRSGKEGAAKLRLEPGIWHDVIRLNFMKLKGVKRPNASRLTIQLKRVLSQPEFSKWVRKLKPQVTCSIYRHCYLSQNKHFRTCAMHSMSRGSLKKK